MRDPRSGPWGGSGALGSPASQVLQTAWGPDRNYGGSTNAPGSPDREPGGGGAQQRPERAGPDLIPRAAGAAPVPNFRPPGTCASWPARPRRAWVPMPPPASSGQRAASPASALTARGTREAGRRARDSGEYQRSSSPQPTPARGGPPGLPDSDHGALAGRSPVPHGGAAAGLYPGQRPERTRAPRPCSGRAHGGGLLRRAGTTFHRPPAPRPLSSRGGTLRAAPLAAGYRGSCATYKSSLCGAILSLSVCGSRVRPAPGAESERRRRPRKVRGAAPFLVEPPLQAEDGRTTAAGGACSPEVLGRSFPYLSGAAPTPASEPNFVAGARSRRRLGTGPSAAQRPRVGSGGCGLGTPERRRRRAALGGWRAAAWPGSGRAAPRGPGGHRFRGGGAARARPGARMAGGVWGGVLWFLSGAPAVAEFGGGTLRLGMRRGGGRGGDGGLRLPGLRGQLGCGRWAWDATRGPISRFPLSCLRTDC